MAKTDRMIEKWDSILGVLYDNKTIDVYKADPDSLVSRYYRACDALREITAEIICGEVEARIEACDEAIEEIKRNLRC